MNLYSSLEITLLFVIINIQSVLTLYYVMLQQNHSLHTQKATGYFSCSKCIQEGDFVQNRVIFPEINNILRTNNSFKNRVQIEYHTGNFILENLLIGMIS